MAFPWFHPRGRRICPKAAWRRGATAPEEYFHPLVLKFYQKNTEQRVCYRRSCRMRKLLLALVCGLLVSSSVGCIIPAYSGDPVRRTQQLIFTSENLRLILDDWERIWFLDQPDHMTPYRTHGGVI